MSYTFTQVQKNKITVLKNAVEADENRKYAEVYQLIANIQLEKNILTPTGMVSLADHTCN